MLVFQIFTISSLSLLSSKRQPMIKIIQHFMLNKGVANRLCELYLDQSNFFTSCNSFSYSSCYKGPSISYVVSKSTIFYLLPPPLSSFLLSKVYLVNRLWGYPAPPNPLQRRHSLWTSPNG